MKAFSQFLLSVCPFGERINYALQYANGKHTPARITQKVKSVCKHLVSVDSLFTLEDKIIVEIGTGWEPTRTLMFYLMGAKRVYTYDHVRHLRTNMLLTIIEAFGNELQYLSETIGIDRKTLESKLTRFNGLTDMAQILEVANITYVAPGDAARTGLNDDSADLVFSSVVFEHVPEKVIHVITEESKRILKPSGVCYHTIGCRDHYAYFDKRISFVNYYRYPEWLWSVFCKNKIHYQNRIPADGYIDLFTSHGACILWQARELKPENVEIVKSMKVNRRFLAFAPEQLGITFLKVMFGF